MDAGSFSLLESATQKTLHANNFNRASSTATHILTDLLSRYLLLLSSTCARYAEHAGRTSVAVGDAVMALDELGVSLEELADYGEVEGRDLSRYLTSTARREEELSVLKGQALVVGCLIWSLKHLYSFTTAWPAARATRRRSTCVRACTKSFAVRRRRGRIRRRKQ